MLRKDRKPLLFLWKGLNSLSNQYECMMKRMIANTIFSDLYGRLKGTKLCKDESNCGVQGKWNEKEDRTF